MSHIEDGGAAFPISREQEGWYSTGMSLRDWFAGQALVGMLASRVNYPVKGDGWNGMAEEAYEAADAILKERRKEGGQ